MKTTKKLLVLCLIAVMAMVAVMPSTFSWYAHSGAIRDTGNIIRLFNASSLTNSDASGTNNVEQATQPVTLPVSLKQKSGDTATVTMNTYEADEYGIASSSPATFSSSCVPAKSANSTGTKNYVTTFTNTGSKDVYIDFNMTGITNSTKAFVGVKSPVINEKNFASRASTPKVSYDKVRVYFEPRGKFTYWDTFYDPTSNSGNGNYYYDFPANAGGDDSNWCDMNIQYGNSSDDTRTYMKTASGKDDGYDVCYQDIKSDSNYFLFFNHYFVSEDKNFTWNQTPDYVPSKCTIYSLNGKKGNNEIKYCDTETDYKVISVNTYHNSVSMAEGGTADIGLTRGESASDTDYDYTANTKASYTVPSEYSSYISVSQDGLITAKANSSGHTAVVTTTLTGKFGDTLELTTNVDIPSAISQVPIAQNVKIPASETVNVEWYVKNTGDGDVGFTNVFYTL